MSTYEQALPIVQPAEEEVESFSTGGISLLESLRIALATLSANKVRTVLTALGVIIGVASVVSLLAIGNGTQEQIAERITRNGANLLTVRAEGAAGGGAAKLTLEDAQVLSDPAAVPDAAQVSPEYNSIAAVVAGSESQTTIIIGVTSVYISIHNNKLAIGSFIDDSQGNSQVAVLGAQVAEDLFGEGADPVGQTIRIKGQSYRVIGVLETKGGGVFSFDDDAVLVPLEVAQRKLFGGRVAGAGGKAAVSSIVVQAKDKDSIDRAKAQIETLLRDRHRLPAGGGA